MSTFRGCLGKVFGKNATATGAATQVREVREWSYEETAEQLDASEIGDCTKKFEAGAVETSGQLSMMWDPGVGSNQSPFTIGDKAYIELYPGGNGSGSTYYKTPTDGATITSVQRGGSVDGLVEFNVGFSVNGSMTATAVP